MSSHDEYYSSRDDGDQYQYQYHHHHHHHDTHTKAAPGGSGGRLLGGGVGGAEEELEGGGGGMAIVFDFTTRVTLFGATSTTRMDYAVLLVFAFGVACATEYVAHARRRQYHHDNANNGQNGSSMTQGEEGGGGAYESATTLTMGHHHHHHHHHNHHQRVLHGAKYATHQLMSYVLMLCVMSLNFGILVSVILGLGVGNYAFNAGAHPRGGRRRASSTLVSDAGCNPE